MCKTYMHTDIQYIDTSHIENVIKLTGIWKFCFVPPLFPINTDIIRSQGAFNLQ